MKILLKNHQRPENHQNTLPKEYKLPANKLLNFKHTKFICLHIYFDFGQIYPENGSEHRSSN